MSDQPYRYAHMNGLPSRVLDVLETDGGWLTHESIALRLDARPLSIDRALWRLRQRGLVERRIVELAGSARGESLVYGSSRWSKVDTRGEWRLL